MSVNIGSPEHRARIIAGYRNALADIEQIFTDAASWNSFSMARKNGAAPINPDPNGSMRRLADQIAFMLAADERSGGIGPIEVVTFDDEPDERQKH